jgi:hypothetical protein
MWKEADFAYVNVPAYNFPTGTNKNDQKLSLMIANVRPRLQKGHF